MNELLLHIAIWGPLVCSVPLLFAGGLARWEIRSVALVGFALPLVCALLLWSRFDPALGGTYQFYSSTDLGLGALGIELALGLNGLSLPLFVLAAVIGFAAGLYALQGTAERLHLYVLLLLLMLGGLMGVFASVDVFFFYFFHELALIPTFIMIGVWGGRDRRYAAMKMTIYLTVGAMLSLAGLILLYVESGADSFNMLDLQAALTAAPLPETIQRHAFALLLFGFGILVSLWPFHTWAPLGYGAAPTGAAMLHAGVLKKFGIYGFLQFALPLLPAGAEHWQMVLAWLALANVVLIGFVTIAQHDLKQMVGFSSVMHMGYCFLGVACLSVLGAGGTVLLMVAHGLSVALLFLLTHCIRQRTGTFDLDEMGGLAAKAPVLAVLFSAAILASIGLPGPGLANFWGELTIFMALYEAQKWMVVPAVFGVVISAVYGLRALAKVLYGEPTEAFRQQMESHPVKDLSLGERLPAILLTGFLIAVGIWPRMFTEGIDASLQANFPSAGPAPQVVHELPAEEVPSVRAVVVGEAELATGKVHAP